MTTRFTVIPDEPIGTISPFLHGQFAEHLGELIYPGIYVSPDSETPNTDGIRHDVVEALKPLDISVLRWPGGCFADNYHWRDGVGPRENRPSRPNVHWGMANEPNQFGTHEFMAFCHAIGAEPYFAANLGSAPPSEMRDWIEYCNHSGESTLTSERHANGSRDPFGVRYWGVGNENWGCGGNMSAAQYANEFARYASFAFTYPGGTSPVKVACGANGGDWNWTRKFFETTIEQPWRLGNVHAFACHYYCGTAGTATEYTEVQWLELLSKAASIEGIVQGHRSIMDEYDPDRKIKLLVDEWGTWHPVEPGKPTGGLYQQNTIRDACVAAISLDVFHNNADRICMANIAQLINVLQAMLLVDETQCIKTPTYHVFDLYRPHKNAQAVRVEIGSPVLSYGESEADACRGAYQNRVFPGLRAIQGSASVRDGMLCVTAVNSDPAQSAELVIDVRGSSLESVELVTLASTSIHAHNTFADPERVTLSSTEVVYAKGGELRVAVPPAAIIRAIGRIS